MSDINIGGKLVVVNNADRHTLAGTISYDEYETAYRDRLMPLRQYVLEVTELLSG